MQSELRDSSHCLVFPCRLRPSVLCPEDLRERVFAVCKDRGQHGGVSFPGLRVLPARVIRRDDVVRPARRARRRGRSRAWPGERAVLGEQSQARVERDPAERRRRPARSGSASSSAREVLRGSRELLRRRFVVRRRAARRCQHPGVRAAPGRRRACDVGWLASPVAWSAAIRKSPEPPLPSPVNMRPVRLAPCAAGASPTITMRARRDRRSRVPASPSRSRCETRPVFRQRRLAVGAEPCTTRADATIASVTVNATCPADRSA